MEDDELAELGDLGFEPSPDLGDGFSWERDGLWGHPDAVWYP